MNKLGLAFASFVFFAGAAVVVGSDDRLAGEVGKIATVEVRGASLAPRVLPRQRVKLIYGYYDRRPVKTGDIVAYRYAGDPDAPIIKIVKALPGDRIQVRRNAFHLYQIFVNGAALVNSEGKLYQITENNIQTLKLYSDSHSAVPEGYYLILGDRVSGTVDSTRFGLAAKKNILGKIELF